MLTARALPRARSAALCHQPLAALRCLAPALLLAVPSAVPDKAGSAKIVARWGVDYLHLAQVDSRWLIRTILWQRPPPGE